MIKVYEISSSCIMLLVKVKYVPLHILGFN